MNIFYQIPPTAGWPIYAEDLLKLFYARTYRGYLEQDFKSYLGLENAWVTYSGTACLYIILEALKEVSRKKTIIIPAFICPLVPLAVARAGLEVEVCDITGGDFNFNFSELENLCAQNKDILATIPAHLGGIPVDFEPLERLVKKYGIFSIEDCAQSLGAEYKNRKTGSLGDFSFFSLCRGKGLTIYEGGVIFAQEKKFAPLIEKKINALVKEDFFAEGLKIMELAGYALFYRPQLFWFIFGLPQAFWNLKGKPLRALIEEFDLDFPLHRVSGIRKLIGHLAFYRMEKQIEAQREKINFYLNGLQKISGIRVIKESSYMRASYPFLTLLFEDSKKRDRALNKLRNSGLGVSIIYARAITDYGYLEGIVPKRDCPAARLFARNHLTLSTSVFLKEKDMENILMVLQDL